MMVASTRAYSMSGSSETASNSRWKTSAFTQSRKRVNTLFQCPNEGGRSRQGLPVRTIHSTASTNSRLSLPLRPGAPGLPRQSGSIFAHWASVNMKRSIRGSKSQPSTDRNPESQQTLGRVDGFDDDEAKSECDEGSEVLVGFLATERNALEALELADEVFDAGARAIERLRKERWSVPGG